MELLIEYTLTIISYKWSYSPEMFYMTIDKFVYAQSFMLAAIVKNKLTFIKP